MKKNLFISTLSIAGLLAIIPISTISCRNNASNSDTPSNPENPDIKPIEPEKPNPPVEPKPPVDPKPPVEPEVTYIKIDSAKCTPSINNFTIEVTGPALTNNVDDYVFISKDNPSVKIKPSQILHVNNDPKKKTLKVTDASIFNKKTTLNNQIDVDFTEFYKSETYVNPINAYYDAKKKEITSFDKYQSFYNELTQEGSPILSNNIIPDKLLLRGSVSLKDVNGNVIVSSQINTSASFVVVYTLLAVETFDTVTLTFEIQNPGVNNNNAPSSKLN